MQEALDEYGDQISENVKEAVHKTALLGVRALKSETREVINGKVYYRGWRTFSKTSEMTQHETIYNAKQPQLTHLLEYGHAKRGGGRTEPRPHISKVDDLLKKTLQTELEARLK